MAPLFELAGIPKGVIQVFTGTGSTGDLLSRHMRVEKVNFTGSVATGRRIQIAAAQSNLKRVPLELGLFSLHSSLHQAVQVLTRANAGKVQL